MKYFISCSNYVWFIIILHLKTCNQSFTFRYLIDLPDYSKNINFYNRDSQFIKNKKSSTIVPPFIIITNHIKKWISVQSLIENSSDQSSRKISCICNYTYEILNLLGPSSGQVITLHEVRNFIGSPELFFYFYLLFQTILNKFSYLYRILSVCESHCFTSIFSLPRSRCLQFPFFSIISWHLP